jgi:hypothetical protein
MRGHEPLLAMRRGGRRPLHVTFTAGPTVTGSDHWSRVPELLPFPEVSVEDRDNLDALDLRFVVGLPVLVDIGPDVERMKRLVLACEAAGAARVYGFSHRDLGHDRHETLAAVCTAGEDQAWRN